MDTEKPIVKDERAEEKKVVVEEKPAKKDEPEVPPNVVQLSMKKRSNSSFVTEACQAFLKFDEIELTGIGGAIQNCVTVAEVMKSKEMGTIFKINTTLIESSTATNRNEPVQKPKIRVFMKKNPNFKYEEVEEKTEKAEAKTEEKAEEKTEEKAEEKTEEKAEEKTEEKAEEKKE